MSRRVVVTDLDETLVWSRREDHAAALRDDLLRPAEGGRGADARAVVARLALEQSRRLGDDLVVVTSRTREQVDRLTLPLPRRVLCLNGAVSLVDGVPETGHRSLVDPLLAASASCAEVLADVAALVDVPWVRGVRPAEDVFAYVLTEGAPPRGWVAELDEVLEPLAWTATPHRRRCYLLPAGLTKHAVLASWTEAHEVTVAAAAGDSMLDEGMLRAAPTSVVPRGSELDGVAPWRGRVTTRASGVMAGAEVVDLLAAAL